MPVHRKVMAPKQNDHFKDAGAKRRFLKITYADIQQLTMRKQPDFCLFAPAPSKGYGTLLNNVLEIANMPLWARSASRKGKSGGSSKSRLQAWEAQNQGA
jgi:hypothetical protein